MGGVEGRVLETIVGATLKSDVAVNNFPLSTGSIAILTSTLLYDIVSSAILDFDVLANVVFLNRIL